ncbi:MAG: spore photoproduct lyase family protein [archaeon]
MRKTQADNVYVNMDILKHPDSLYRFQRIIECISTSYINYLSKEQMLEKVLENYNLFDNNRTGAKLAEPIFLFDEFDFKRQNIDYSKCLSSDGFNFADLRDQLQLHKEHKVYCNSAYEIHSVFGCLHRCTYCHIGPTITMMLNIEDLIKQVGCLMDKTPWQKLYKYDNQSDILLFEPEYDAVRPLIEFFAGREREYLMLYSKSDNIDSILDLEHNGHTIACWTLSPTSVVEGFELGTPFAAERILAAEKCENNGYPVRFRFSPIIPIKGWQDQYDEIINLVFDKTSPDIITIQSLCHMNFGQAKKALDLDLIEPYFISQMRQDHQTHQYELFSVDARVEMFSFILERINFHSKRRNKQVKTSLCLETKEVWEKLKSKLSTTLPNQLCACAPFSVP